jgi:hypothetical protein
MTHARIKKAADIMFIGRPARPRENRQGGRGSPLKRREIMLPMAIRYEDTRLTAATDIMI